MCRQPGTDRRPPLLGIRILAGDQGDGDPLLYEGITATSLPVLKFCYRLLVEEDMNAPVILRDRIAAQETIPFD